MSAMVSPLSSPSIDGLIENARRDQHEMRLIEAIAACQRVLSQSDLSDTQIDQTFKIYVTALDFAMQYADSLLQAERWKNVTRRPEGRGLKLRMRDIETGPSIPLSCLTTAKGCS